MNILAIDTSSKKLCVGLMNDKGRIFGYDLDSGVRHTELLLPAIKKALARAKLSLKQIDYLAAGLGPGSFTGLRIGLATIKGFAAALEKPAVGLPALDILARNALPADGVIVCPVVDARRNLVYSALYKVTSNGLKRRGAYLLVSIDELLKRIGARTFVTFLGDGLRMHQQRLEQKLRNSSFLSERAWYPRAQTLIELAKELIDKGKIDDAGSLRPIYLYPKECQIRSV